MIKVNFELNGKSRIESVDPIKRLSEFLRDDMGLSATKVGCNAGDCGSCTVMIDGKTACSCLVSASQINGSKIETLENMARDCLLYTSPSPRDGLLSRMPSSA